ncbi:uncharacterized protein LOC131849707 isoform X2 [Achroia grisella]|uniref:uncharacterized protein LOC131849707 isoform X2 n=1 Tax=Achroia grisella TaxID=688607 RepID=UPI0027D33D05|nr:uncharacterized protein LOC131849707 isoform X2 [Achroia grisella]
MNRNPDIMFMAEYIKNVLYFATVRPGKVLKNTAGTHYFTIDNDLVYENYYSDFGPLNLGCVYKYCRILNEKLKQYLNKQIIIHYTSIDTKKKANAAFLLGCYGVLYLSLTPRDALKPLMVHGQSYRPFQDAIQGDSCHTINLFDCLQAIKKARELGFFNFQDFNYEEYDRLDKIQGGDLNWIVPGKFLAFIGPVDCSVSLYHPPEMYIDYFLENKVKIVIRLNKRLYDSNIFSNVGITHYDLFFPDGSCPPRHILFKFLQISEGDDGAIAVHCKAGLGRTGSLIGCYLMKHYRMTSHEAIGWMRICRPGSVIGHQQSWLEELEPWLLKQGNIYRKRIYQNTEKFPIHEFGVYSITEKTIKQRPVIFHKSPSPPPPMQREIRSDFMPVRPQASRVREEKNEEEIFLTSCDLTTKSVAPMTQIKGCVIKNEVNLEECNENDQSSEQNMSFWKKYLCCHACFTTCNNTLWMLAVRCAGVTPKLCENSIFCDFIDRVAPYKMAEKESSDCRVRVPRVNSQKTQIQSFQNGIQSRDRNDVGGVMSQRGSGAGEPRGRSPLPGSTARSQVQRNSSMSNELNSKISGGYNHPIPTFRTTQGPIIKTINDARNFLMKSSIYKVGRERQLNSSITITPRCTYRASDYAENFVTERISHVTPSSFSTVTRGPTQPQCRRRLGRSPSPPQRYEQSRATNTPTTAERFLAKDTSKSAALREELSRLKLSCPRDGSIGAASLGARRDAPAPKRAPSVRSDERPHATQGDLLNSIKFQRRFRDSFHSDKLNTIYTDKLSAPKEKSSTASRDFAPPRPNSPKGRRNANSTFH